MRSSRFTVLFFTLLLVFSSCEDRNYYAIGGYAQGGTWSVKYRGASIRPEKVQAKADSLLREIDFTLSGYNKASLLSKFNAGDSVVITPMFAELYRLCYEMWESTDGAFDAACGPLFDIWGFGFTSDQMPSDELVSKTLASCGTARLIEPDLVDEFASSGKLVCANDFVQDGNKGGVRVNFNAIAQGYSCDLVFNMLRGLGATDMLVDIGEIRCCGVNPNGRGWTIGIDNPIDGNDTPGADLRDKWTSDGGDYGVVTSGNYRKFYIRDGKKYSHTIDPRNGYPVSHQLLSATVIAADGATADALATYFMVIGYDEARNYLRLHPELGACLITSDTCWKSWTE